MLICWKCLLSFIVENKGATAEEIGVEHVDGHLVWSNQSGLFPIDSQSLHGIDIMGGCKRKRLYKYQQELLKGRT